MSKNEIREVKRKKKNKIQKQKQLRHHFSPFTPLPPIRNRIVTNWPRPLPLSLCLRSFWTVPDNPPEG